MVTVNEVLKAQRAEGVATVLAIGTATPPNCVDQSQFPDYYFRVTKSEHKIELKQKLKRICDKSMIKKRYMHLTEEILKENPDFCEYMAPSLDARQDILVVDVPKLGKAAAVEAINEWGQCKTKITHLIFCATTGADLPGADYHLAKLLDLSPSVKRFMIYQHGCFAGGTVLRLAKDIAENNRGARVLVVCSELTLNTFRGPNENHPDNLVSQAIFGDGASAVIVGSDPIPDVEKPLFEIVSTAQSFIPDTSEVLGGQVRKAGILVHLHKDIPRLISMNIEKSLTEAFQPLGISDWDSLFWIVHPGGPAILDQMQVKLRLKPDKLRAARQVLSDYGNLASASVFFVMDEMRKKSNENGLESTGEGLDWGVLIGFGPGLTIETVVLHSKPIHSITA